MDKSNIRTVIHFTLPSSVEAYLQESGRAGRDRQPCRAILLYHPEDRHRESANPNGELKRRYEKLLAFAEDNGSCRRESLLAILEAEPEDCNSCDVCRDEVITKDPCEDHILGITAKYRDRLTSDLLIEFLLGRYSQNIRQGYWYRAAGFASMRGISPDDAKDMIRSLILSGSIRERKHRGRTLRPSVR